MAYVQTARIGYEFYKSKKFCMSTKELSKLSEVKKLSLLIPSFSNFLTCDGDLPEEHFGYFGYTDHGMKFTKKETELQETWHKYQSSVKSVTIGEVRSQFPKFDKVCDSTFELAKCLREKGYQPLVFNTGGKGFRVMWHDLLLFRKVVRDESYGNLFIQQVAPDYFANLGIPYIVELLDYNVYDKKKGVKPDVLAHPITRLWPAFVDCTSLESFNSSIVFGNTEDVNLSNLIIQYWCKLVELLKAQNESSIPLLYELHDNQARSERVVSQSRRQQRVSDALIVVSPSSTVDQEFKTIIKSVLSRYGNTNEYAPIKWIPKPKQQDWEGFHFDYSQYCLNAEKHHSSYQTYYIFNPTTCCLSQRCFGDSCYGKPIVLYEEDQIINTQTSEQILESLNSDELDLETQLNELDRCYGMALPCDLKCMTLNQRYMLPSSNNEEERLETMKQLMLHSTVCLRSMMGTGKTELLAYYLRWLNNQMQNLRILMLTSRVTFANSVHARLNRAGLDFVSYLSPNADFTANRLIVQLDSLVKIVPKDKVIPAQRVDILVLDECESLLLHIASPLMKQRGKVYQLLQYLVKSSVQVLMMDADLSLRSWQWIQYVRPNAP